MATKDDIKDMATKDDVRAIVAEELKPVHSDIKAILDTQEELGKKYENVRGYGKEIDHVLGRTPRIEEHLGIEPQMAA